MLKIITENMILIFPFLFNIISRSIDRVRDNSVNGAMNLVNRDRVLNDKTMFTPT